MADAVAKAFDDVPRANFVLPEYADRADWDVALPIGFGQTISQPSTVESMLRWLEIEPGNKVLDVGSGSGWSAALLSRLVGATGKIHAVELIPELVVFGRGNCQRLGIENTEFHLAGKFYGLPKHAPYDRILVSAAANSVPGELIDQLKKGGKLVIPVGNDIIEIDKTLTGKLETNVHPGYVFVPLVPGNQ